MIILINMTSLKLHYSAGVGPAGVGPVAMCAQ